MTLTFVVALFAAAAGYAAGRVDRRDLGPWRRRTHHLDPSVVALEAYRGRFKRE